MIDIIGAGIGGLTTAIGLEQKGIEATLYEKADEIKPVGAGIVLANNAMQIFECLGLRSVIEEKGNIISSMNITKADLSPMSSFDLSFFEKKYSVKNIAIHRGTLQKILLDSLNSTTVHLNHDLSDIKKNDSGYTLSFDNGVMVKSPAVIGADGIHSKVRKSIFPNNTIRYAKQICWRGVVDFELPKQYQHELNEAWGREDRFGFVQVSKGRVYWFAVKSYKNDSTEYPLHDLDLYFKGYHPVVQSIIASTPKEKIYTSEISDLKPMKEWSTERMCLIGDAAHAMTPNLGQGAGQSIEDAFVLSECLAKYELTHAFQEYQKLRLPKVLRIVNNSWSVGKIAHVSNPILIGFRNQMLKWTPTSMARKQSEQIFKIAEV